MKLLDFTKSLICNRLSTKKFDNSPPGSIFIFFPLRSDWMVEGSIPTILAPKNQNRLGKNSSSISAWLKRKI